MHARAAPIHSPPPPTAPAPASPAASPCASGADSQSSSADCPSTGEPRGLPMREQPLPAREPTTGTSSCTGAHRNSGGADLGKEDCLILIFLVVNLKSICMTVQVDILSGCLHLFLPHQTSLCKRWCALLKRFECYSSKLHIVCDYLAATATYVDSTHAMM